MQGRVRPQTSQISSSNATTSYADIHSSEISQTSRAVDGGTSLDPQQAIVLRRDENILRILSLGMEEKIAKNSLSKVDLSDALVKVVQHSGQLTLKQSANFLFAVSKLLQHGYNNLNAELREFFARFKDHLMKAQQQAQVNRGGAKSSRGQQQKKRLKEAARELADNLSGSGSNLIEERSNTSIQQPRHISTEERLNLQEQNLISPMLIAGGSIRLGEEDLSSSENSNNFANLADTQQARRMEMLGEDEGSLAGDDRANGQADFDNFHYDFSDRDSHHGGGINGDHFDISQELKNVTDMSQRLIKQIAVNYSGQQQRQSSNKKTKKRSKQSSQVEGVNDENSFEYDVEVLAQEFDLQLEDFFAAVEDKNVDATSKWKNDSLFGFTTILSTDPTEATMNLAAATATNTSFLGGTLNATFRGDAMISGLIKQQNEVSLSFDNNADNFFNQDFLAKLEKTMLLVQPDFAARKNNEDNFSENQQDDYMQIPYDLPNDEGQDYHQAQPAGLTILQDEQDPRRKIRGEDVVAVASSKALTEEEKKKLSHYEKVAEKVKEIVESSDGIEKKKPFNEIFKAFKNQKHKAELFYDLLELQKLGQVSISQENKLKFTPVFVSLS